jgi:hypothetical protein
VNQRFQQVTVYFDTPFLLDALGYAGKEIAQPALELLGLIRGWLASGTRSPSSKGCWAGSPTGCGTPAGAALTLSRVEEHCVPEGLGPSDIEVRRVGPVIRSPARLAVRFPFRAHICGLVPASDVNWLAAANWWHGEGP